MLPKVNRLSPSWVVEKVRRRGRRLQTRLFRLFYTQHRHGDRLRFAFVVPATVSKQAVQRNRLRRRAREAVKPLIPELNPGQDFVFLFKPAALNKKVNEIRAEVVNCLKNS